MAEGRRRGTQKEFKQFLVIAFGSGAELETQIEIAKRRKYIKEDILLKIEGTLEEVMKMLNKMINS